MVWISAAIVLATALSSMAAPIPADRQRIDDTVVLKTFSMLSKLQSALYEAMLNKFTDDDYTDAGFATPDVPKQLLTELLTDERAHVTFFDQGLRSNPLNGCTPNLVEPLKTVKSAMETARLLEEVSVAAFQGASQLITDKNILGTAASVLPNEAQHQFVMNFMNGQSGSPHSFGMSLRPEQALAAISPFIAGCDPGILGNRALSIASTTLTPGQQVTFNATGLPTGQSLFCQMMVEGNPQALSQPLEQCLLPNDIIEGPVYMFITNKVQPLPANILTQDTSSIEAGPIVAFIKGSSTPFNQVLMPDLEVAESGQPSNRTFTFTGGAPEVKVHGVHFLSLAPDVNEIGVHFIPFYKPDVRVVGIHTVPANAPRPTEGDDDDDDDD